MRIYEFDFCARPHSLLDYDVIPISNNGADLIKIDISLSRGDFRLEAAAELPESGVTALIGASGSGKTTLAHALAGLVRPERGRLEVNGETFFDAAGGIDAKPHERGIGYLFQAHRLFPNMTVRENLYFGRRFGGRPVRIDDKRLIETLGVGHLLERLPDSLSGGESQRVALGRAVLAAQTLLILDEPLSSLDPERREELLEYMERVLPLTDLPVLYITHAMEEAERLASHVLVLERGRVVRNGPAGSFLAA